MTSPIVFVVFYLFLFLHGLAEHNRHQRYIKSLKFVHRFDIYHVCVTGIAFYCPNQLGIVLHRRDVSLVASATGFVLVMMQLEIVYIYLVLATEYFLGWTENQHLLTL